jgi:membrane protease YdiL (CAAX protease family)
MQFWGVPKALSAWDIGLSNSRAGTSEYRSDPPLSEELAQQAKSFPVTVLRIAGLHRRPAGTALAHRASAMNSRPRSFAYVLPELRAIGLFSLFVGGAWSALRATSGTGLGMLIGPLAAQLTMALVIFVGARLALRAQPAPARTRPHRRLTMAPLVIIACGGFMIQAATLAGSRLFVAATIPGLGGRAEVPLAWTVLALTSVVGAPLLEELFFRGMLQPLLSRRHVVAGLLATAALFGLAHGFEMPFRAMPAFLQGLVLGGVTLLTGRLRGAVVVHALNNAFVLAAATIVALNPDRLMHGVHGSEAGWMGSVFAMIGMALVGWGFVRILREPRIGRFAAAASAA